MKPSTQTNKSGSSNSKSKRSSKDREKRKSQGGNIEINNHNNSVDKGSPTKESSTRLYAGIDAESLSIYAEQFTVEQISEDVSNAITEDINYKLRYIINEALIKARLSGKNAISSQDIEQTFSNLRIDPVYGATSKPDWIPFGNQNLFYLEDKQVNLIEIVEEEKNYVQSSETIITTSWVPGLSVSKSFKKYFVTICPMLVSADIASRKMALKSLSESSTIGPITEWFYNFGYILLSKDITYDCLTLRALCLIDVLENNPICRISVLEKQLLLLVRLILQRLLKYTTSNEVLKPMCRVLCILCNRMPLREFVIFKILQKMPEVCQNHGVPVITIINTLGIDAVQQIFLPNMDVFLVNLVQTNDPQYIYAILETYSIIASTNLLNFDIYSAFHEIFGEALILSKTLQCNKLRDLIKKEINVIRMKCDLIFTRRKCVANGITKKNSVEEIFEKSPLKRRHICISSNYNYKITCKFCDGTFTGKRFVNDQNSMEMTPETLASKKKVDNLKWGDQCDTAENSGVVIGKTSLMLPIFHEKKPNLYKVAFCDYDLLQYNI